jgi:hypothetical protein
MKRSFPVLLAILVIVLSTLACNFGSKPAGVSNIRMTTDDTGDTTTTVYAPTDSFFFYFDANKIEPGTLFESRWYVLDYEKQDPTLPFKTSTYSYEEGNSRIYFQLSAGMEWPVSPYRVELYMNDEKIGEVMFEVKAIEEAVPAE